MTPVSDPNLPAVDVVVIGGGIAGISLAYELAESRSVRVLEGESQLALHTTGRSAATWIGTYGPPVVRRLTVASRPVFTDPTGHWSHLSRPMGSLTVAPEADAAALEAEYAEIDADRLGCRFDLLDADAVRRLNPAVRESWVAVGSYEPDALDLDVAALHAGYVRGARARGVDIRTDSRLVGAERSGGTWLLTDAAGEQHRCANVVVAAGAWSDDVARRCGAEPLGIRPLRRTLFTSPVADSERLRGLPITGDQAGLWYWKPEGGGVLCSPNDETPHEPGVPQVDELDVARAMEAVDEACDLGLRSVGTSWAGLRCFAPDGVPVVGPDPGVEGLFWYAGQGGYGIQMGPALARAGAAVFLERDLPADLRDLGVTPAALSPSRLRHP